MSKHVKGKTSKAAPEKKAVVAQIQKFGKEYPIIGILNMENLPAGALLKMKKQLRGKVELVMTRKTLIKKGLLDLKLTNGDELVSKITGMPALMFTKESPFALYRTLKRSKTPAPAKAGQNAPRDLMVPKGPTPFTPGPVISEFAALGIKAGVEGGKVAVKEDTVVVREGKPISDKLASMLQRLGIEPMEIGLDLVCAYEKGIIYGRSVLDVDETQFMANLIGAASEAFNLACDIGWANKDTIETLLGKAFRQAKQVSLDGGILSPELVDAILAKAYREATEVATEGNIQTQN